MPLAVNYGVSFRGGQAGSRIVFDDSKVLKNLAKFQETAMKGATAGVAAALNQWHVDALLQEPTAPRKYGYLRGSGATFVNGRPAVTASTAAVVAAKGGKRAFMPSSAPPVATIVGAQAIVGLLIFGAPYAAVREIVPARRYTTPGSGAHYLESKGMRNMDKYVATLGFCIAAAMSDAFPGAAL